MAVSWDEAFVGKADEMPKQPEISTSGCDVCSFRVEIMQIPLTIKTGRPPALAGGI
jgi:hypothetical protein